MKPVDIVGRDIERLQQARNDHRTDHECEPKRGSCPIADIIIKTIDNLMAYEIDTPSTAL